MEKANKHNDKKFSTDAATIYVWFYFAWLFLFRWWLVPLLNLIPGVHIKKMSGLREYLENH